MRKPTLHELYKLLMVIVTLISFYYLISNFYYKQYSLISVWHFPMLLAILLELYIY